MEASAIHAPAVAGRIRGAGPLLRLRSDDQLVALFRMGYDDAFGVIHDRYRQRLLAYTRQMLGGSRSDAEDALQDVFLRAYGALRHDDRPVTLRAWLYRVAHNRCVDQLRRPVPAPSELLDVSRAPLRDPHAETERREQVRRLVADVRRLPEQQRSALLMRQIDGVSYAEIADALGVSVPAVKSLLVRARMGLVEAGEARDTACTDIRADLAVALHRGVRMSGRSRRHLRDCVACKEYRLGLRGLQRELAGRSPGHGALAGLAKLLGIGGAGSGAAVGAGTVAVGTPIAAKITALVCCGAAVAGVAELKAHPTAVAPAPGRAIPTATAPPAPPTAAVLQRVDRRVPPAAAPAPTHPATRARAVARPRLSLLPARGSALPGHRIAAPLSTAPRDAARTTGGALAPDDLAPSADEPAIRDTPAATAAPGDAVSIPAPDTAPAAPSDPQPPAPETAPAPPPPAATPTSGPPPAASGGATAPPDAVPPAP